MQQREKNRFSLTFGLSSTCEEAAFNERKAQSLILRILKLGLLLILIHNWANSVVEPFKYNKQNCYGVDGSFFRMK